MAGDPFNPSDNDPMARTVMVPSPSNRKPRGVARQPVDGSTSSRNFTVPKSGKSFDLAAYPNPLIRAAGPLLMSAIQLKETLSNSDPNAVRKRMSAEMRAFDQNAKNFGVSISQTNAARYLLCTFVDEVVMTTPWGSQSGWSGRSLLSEFYGETFGGEKVFTVIDRAMREPEKNSLLLELAYVILSLGFEGQYRVRDGGKLKIIQDSLYQTLRRQTPATDKLLSPNWRGEESNRSDRLMKIVPLWMIALIGLGVMGFLYGIYALALNEVREPVYRIVQQIEAEGRDLMAAAPAPEVEPFDLEERLSPFVGDGLEVDVTQGVATISLVGAHDALPLYRSGSARLHRRASPMLQKVAAILEEIPGSVTITGHTDSQGRVLSNQALSERRAKTVMGELVYHGADKERFETRGFGSNQPVIANEKTAEDRAANRRVEIRFRVPDTMDRKP